MIDFHRSGAGTDAYQAAELDGIWLVGAGGHDVQHVFEFHFRIFGILHADEVLVAALGVDPEVAVDSDAGIHRGGHLVHDVVLAQAGVGGLLAIHFDDPLGGIEPLLNMDVGRAGSRVVSGGEATEDRWNNIADVCDRTDFFGPRPGD